MIIPRMLYPETAPHRIIHNDWLILIEYCLGAWRWNVMHRGPLPEKPIAYYTYGMLVPYTHHGGLLPTYEQAIDAAKAWCDSAERMRRA
jgi:hypothetical protein